MQFGHLFAKGPTRESAIRALVVALKQVKIRGEIRTTVDYTTDMIQHEAFMGNNHHTGWLDSRIAAHVSHLLLALLVLPPAFATLHLLSYSTITGCNQQCL